MKVEEAEEYTQSLGQIVSGSWRQIAWAERNGVPEALGMTTREWVEQRLGGYIKLAIEDRREAVKELTGNGMSQREVADVLGVDQATVNRDANASEPPEQQAETQEDSESADADASEPEAPPPKPRMSRKEIAAKEEESIRDTLIRVTERAYSCTIAWSVAGFAKDAAMRLKDDDFRRELLRHLHHDPSAMAKIQKGTERLISFLSKLKIEEPRK